MPQSASSTTSRVAGLQLSVDRLGRTITQLINEQSSLATPEEVSQQLLECRAFREALLTPIFEAKMHGGGRVRLTLLADSLSIAGGGSSSFSRAAVAAAPQVEAYTTMSIEFEAPTLTLTSQETSGKLRFDLPAADGERVVEELDDRIQLARHMLQKEEQWKLSQFDSIEFQRRAVGSGGSSATGDRAAAAVHRRKLDEM